MARRNSGGGGGGGANWMDTYGDLVTLLLCFFVLLYSMSSMDEAKWQYIAQAFSAGKGEIINVVVDEPNPENDPSAIYVDEEQEENSQDIDFDEFYMYLNEAVESAGLQDQVSVEMADTGVYMKFRDNVFFAGDSYKLLDEGKYILEIICDGIRAVDKHVFAIKVNGHTAKSASSSVNEWELSSGRASSVINYMLSLDCCDPEKFSAAGYGKYRPVSDNDTEDGKRQNRRVEIVFIRNDVDLNNPEVVKELMELEFGTSFVSYSDADGNAAGGNEEAAPAETSPAAPEQNNGSYSSKNDRLNEMKHNPPTVTSTDEGE
ncbi:MAG: flagellar motor protein MotB [Oscillospiraceae bacterium]|nr:flagellar motor protein MotB [Oscillospiraceae bacterium]